MSIEAFAIGQTQFYGQFLCSPVIRSLVFMYRINTVVLLSNSLFPSKVMWPWFQISWKGWYDSTLCLLHRTWMLLMQAFPFQITNLDLTWNINMLYYKKMWQLFPEIAFQDMWIWTSVPLAAWDALRCKY